MAVVVKATQRGGQKLKKLLAQAGKVEVKEVEVGFFPESRYDDGTPVAAVAAWNEFGTETIPERPFFRRAIAKMEEEGLAKVLGKGIDRERLVIDRRVADKIGAYAAEQVQQSITDLKEPPNAPETIRRKGSDDPLIDTGRMRRSVTWRVS